MNRNVESHFARVPHANIPRSRFDRSYNHITTFNVGDVVPIYMDQTVMPGDTVTLDTSMVVRLQTLLTPIFDNVYLDTYFFAIPKRLLWKHWKNFMGENTDSAWLPETTYTEPQMKAGSGDKFAEGTVSDYLGVPINCQGSVSALPFRAYAMVCDYWFRDENLTDPLVLIDGDSDTEYDSDGSCEYGGLLFKASKYHDYFTSCLPAPIRSAEPVQVPTNFTAGIFGYVSPFVPAHGALLDEIGMNPTGEDHIQADMPLTYHRTAYATGGTRSLAFDTFKNTQDTNKTGLIDADYTEAQIAEGNVLRPDNLYSYIPESLNIGANIARSNAYLSISDLRNAFQVAKLLERDARSGVRYQESIRAHFGVSSPDSRMQIPEYLGGKRINISVHQVVNQSEGESQFLGNLGAFGLTTDRNSCFTYSATEHCIILGVCVARYDHTYSQGIDRSWLNKTRLDYYFPVLSCISEQPVYTEEIYTKNIRANKTGWSVFGYQEPFANYRYCQNRCSSEMRPDATLTLASWHLGDDYASRPYLSDDWIREDKANVDRVLAVTSSVSKQIMLDVRFNQFWTRPMPLFGVPGLVDHF